MQYVVLVKLFNVNYDFIYNVMYLIYLFFQYIKKKYFLKMDICFVNVICSFFYEIYMYVYKIFDIQY